MGRKHDKAQLLAVLRATADIVEAYRVAQLPEAAAVDLSQARADGLDGEPAEENRIPEDPLSPEPQKVPPLRLVIHDNGTAAGKDAVKAPRKAKR